MQHNHIVKYMFISLSLSELKMISFHKKKKKKKLNTQDFPINRNHSQLQAMNSRKEQE